jgi:polysaccharide export outer membrane protein
MTSRIVAFAGLALVVSCAPRRVAVPASPTAPPIAAGNLVTEEDRTRLEGIVAARAPNVDHGGNQIGPDDLLQIRIPDLMDAAPAVPTGSETSPILPVVAAAPSFQEGVRVGPDGNITLPLVGMVHAAGLTSAGLEQEIARKLVAGGLLRRPQVSVQVIEHRSQVVAVVGSVERPGLYPLTRPGATLADLIWAAGGPTKDAGRVVAFVPVGAYSGTVTDAIAPGAPAQGEPVRLDLQELLHARGQDSRLMNPYVRPGDLISVSPAGTVQVDGWVDKPGSYPATRGMTLTGAVAAAGGHLFPADRHHVMVKRQLDPGQERNFTVDMDLITHGQAPDLPITDGDVITLPASAARMVPYGAWQIVRELVRVGGSIAFF